jgi:hypothetical protein
MYMGTDAFEFDQDNQVINSSLDLNEKADPTTPTEASVTSWRDTRRRLPNGFFSPQIPRTAPASFSVK